MNTASRILSIYNKLTAGGWSSDKAMGGIWSEIFDLLPSGEYLEDDVVTCLQATRAEFDLMQKKLLAKGLPRNIVIESAWVQFHDATAPRHLNTNWGGLRERISVAEIRVSLMWASWVLSDEDEALLEPEQRAALSAELDSLEESLLHASMSPYLASFIARQIATIRTALRVYQVQGARAVDDAMQKVAGAFTLERSHIEDDLFEAPEDAVQAFTKTTTVVEKTAGLLDGLRRAGSKGANPWCISEHVSSLLIGSAHLGEPEGSTVSGPG